MDFNHIPMLSNQTCKALGLVKIVEESNTDNMIAEINVAQGSSSHKLVEEFKDLFKGLGKMKEKIKLQVNENITPRIQKPRRIPIFYRKEVKSMLKDLEDQGILKSVNQHTPWVSNMLLVKKDNKIRLCLDPVYLNKALLREEYQMPTLDEILPELKNAKVFSTFGAKKGFWQLSLDEDSIVY